MDHQRLLSHLDVVSIAVRQTVGHLCVRGRVVRHSLTRLPSAVGRKQCLLTGLAIFFLGSLAASLAPNVISLIIFRAFCGIGGGGLMSIAQIIVGDVVPLRERGKYQGILGAVVAVANGVGPVVGGALAGAGPDSWRNIFRLNLPLCFLCAVCVVYFMPLRAVEGSWKAKVRAIDYVGAFLALGSTTAVVVSEAVQCGRSLSHRQSDPARLDVGGRRLWLGVGACAGLSTDGRCRWCAVPTVGVERRRAAAAAL